MKHKKTDKDATKQSTISEAKNVKVLKVIQEKDSRVSKQKEAYIQNLKNGVTRLQATEAIGVCTTTVWNWRQADKEFSDNEKEALESRIQVVEDALYQSATGKEGKAKIIAQIFWLKNRGKNWKDKQDITFTAPKEVKQNTFVRAGEEPVIEEEKPGDKNIDDIKLPVDPKPETVAKTE